MKEEKVKSEDATMAATSSAYLRKRETWKGKNDVFTEGPLENLVT